MTTPESSGSAYLPQPSPMGAESERPLRSPADESCNAPPTWSPQSKPHRLLGQHLRQVQHVAPPFDLAVVAHLPDERPRGIVDRRQLHGIRPGRPLMDTPACKAPNYIPAQRPRTDVGAASVAAGRPTAAAPGIRSCRPLPLGVPGRIRWGRMPSNHAAKRLRPPSAVEANGGPLSVRIVSGSPYPKDPHKPGLHRRRGGM